MPSSGYSGTPLAKKLGIKEGFKIMLYNQPGHYFKLFADLPQSFEIVSDFNAQSVDFIHLFCLWSNEMKDLVKDYKGALKKDGLLWISWP